MKKLLSKTLIAVVLMCTAGLSSAASMRFIDNDTYTTDTVGGLDWLDVTITANQSFSYVSSQFGAGGLYEGWRYATAREFNFYIVPYVESFRDPVTGWIASPQGFSEVTQFASIMSYWAYNDGQGVNGLLSDPTSRLGYVLGQIRVDHNAEWYDSWAGAGLYADPTWWLENRKEWGSFLVRDNNLSPVPVPAAAWLFGSALLGFAGFSRRRKNKVA